jgi:hypothetical protein
MRTRNNLVISAVGDCSLHRTWIENQERTFDLWLIYYGDDERVRDAYASQCELFVTRKGQKLQLIGDLLKTKEISFEDYKYVWIPDDDIAASAKEIELLFRLMKKYSLDVAQPALHGYINHPITKVHSHFECRFTNFVEVMAPCFSKRAISRCSGHFRESLSGWGLDYLWWQLLGERTDNCAILDCCPVIHTRPFQSNKRFAGAHTEMEELLKRHRLNEKPIAFSAKWHGLRLNGFFTRALNKILSTYKDA